jgi:hypothetical protein
MENPILLDSTWVDLHGEHIIMYQNNCYGSEPQSKTARGDGLAGFVKFRGKLDRFIVWG